MAAWLGALAGVCSLIVTIYKVNESSKIAKMVTKVIQSYGKTVDSYRNEVTLLKEGKAIDVELERQRLELEKRKQTLREAKALGGAVAKVFREWKESDED